MSFDFDLETVTRLRSLQVAAPTELVDAPYTTEWG